MHIQVASLKPPTCLFAQPEHVVPYQDPMQVEALPVGKTPFELKLPVGSRIWMRSYRVEP